MNQNSLQEAINIWYSSSSIDNLLTILYILLATAIFLFIIPYLITKYKKQKAIKENFLQECKDYNLDDNECDLLWKNIDEYYWNPSLVLNNKKAFEKISSKIINKDRTYAQIISKIRSKLGFESLPWFLPLSSSKDIDIYQVLTIKVGDLFLEGALWDKDELCLTVGLFDVPSTLNLKLGQKVKVSLEKDSSDKYSFETEICEINTDNQKVVIKLKHVDKLEHTTLRQTVRWETTIFTQFVILKKEELKSILDQKIIPDFEEDRLREGLIKDIGPGGVRLCVKEKLDAKEGDTLMISFRINQKEIRDVLGEIRTITDVIDHTCYGIKFLNLNSSQEEAIRLFVIDEQRKLLKAYKTGEI